MGRPEAVTLADADGSMHAQAAEVIASRLERVVLGQRSAIRETLAALLARGHILLEGVPGTAKTLLVRSLALALGATFRRIQFTPDLMPSDITGVSVLGADGSFRFRPGPLFGDLILADEINRAPAKTQAALLEAMQERSVTVDGTSHALSRDFTVFATQNPVEFEGTYPLPEAELDRFLVKISLGYPDDAVEQAILVRVLEGFEADEPASFGIEPIGGDPLGALRSAARCVRVEPALLGYIASIVRATRSAPTITLGASPRASVALLKVSQATALLDGRVFVTPDDIKALAAPVLRHRIVVAPELELEGVSADDAIRAVMERIEVPRQ